MRRLLPFLVLALLPAAAAFGESSAGSSTPAQRPVIELLGEMEEDGLRLIWSERLVSEAFRSPPPPPEGPVEERLRVVLEPHGLEAFETSAGRWVVARAAGRGAEDSSGGGSTPELEPERLVGRVVSSEGVPIAGALVRLEPDGPSGRTDEDGWFELPVGSSKTVVVTAPGFATLRQELEDLGDEALRFELRPATARFEEDVTVTGSWSLLRDGPATASGLDEAQISALPHFGDDLFRVVTALPGTTSTDFSSRFSVRGSGSDEVLVQFDGLELLSPFHLEDFQGVFSIVDPEAVSAVDLLPGGFPVDSGDRAGAVLDLTSRRPSARRVSLGISFSNAWLGGAGTFADDRGSWLATFRRGYLDIVLGLVDEDSDDDETPDPRYWDLFGKTTWSHGPSAETSLQVLASEDRLRFEELENRELTRVRTGYDSRYAWVRHRRGVGDRLLLHSLAGATRLENLRDAFSDEAGFEEFFIDDTRRLDLWTVRQEAHWASTERGEWRAGVEARRQQADYRVSTRHQLLDPIDDPRFEPGTGALDFHADVDRDQMAGWLARRFRARRTTIELGIRWDRQTNPDESQWSPRLHVVRELGGAGRLRFAWGLFHQSERAHEIAAEHGETAVSPARESEHWTLGWDRSLGDRSRVRVELYRRDVSDPAPRWETVFDPFQPFPEFSIGRVLLAPTEARAQGIEVDWRGRWTSHLDSWLTVAAAETEERIGGLDVPRFQDQPWAAQVGLGWRPGPRWSLSAVWSWHSGWPTTGVTATWSRLPGEAAVIEYDVGPIYGERLDDYHRLDVRIARAWQVAGGHLTAFLDVQNLYDRENPRGIGITDSRFLEGDGASGAVAFPENHWLPMLPSFGISWER